MITKVSKIVPALVAGLSRLKPKGEVCVGATANENYQKCLLPLSLLFELDLDFVSCLYAFV